MIFIIVIIIGVLILLAEVLTRTHKPQEKISFRETFDIIGLPIITFVIQDHKFNFVLDTGSTDNLINLQDLVNAGITYEAKEKTNMFGIDGNPEEVIKADFNLVYNSKVYPMRASIKDLSLAFNNVKKSHGVTIHGLLGSKFFESYKYVIDFNKMVAIPNRI